LSYFYVAHIGLGAAQPLGEIDLAQDCRPARFPQLVAGSKAERLKFTPRYIAQNNRAGRRAPIAATRRDV